MEILYYNYCDEFEIDTNIIRNTGIRDLIRQISENGSLIYDVQPRMFEEIVNQLLQDQGFKTILTQPTRDGGRDIIAQKEGINGKPVVFYVECKRYAQKNKVDVKTVRALYGVQTADKINKACIITSSSFTSKAIEFAEQQNVMIDLIDGDALHAMIQQSAKKYDGQMIL